jgi:hypothetical protein
MKIQIVNVDCDKNTYMNIILSVSKNFSIFESKNDKLIDINDRVIIRII